MRFKTSDPEFNLGRGLGRSTLADSSVRRSMCQTRAGMDHGQFHATRLFTQGLCNRSGIQVEIHNRLGAVRKVAAILQITIRE
jgi:hypothetical protein